MADSITFSAGLDFSKGIQDAQKVAGEISRILSTGINSANFTRPLGQISSATKDFENSLNAANARVFAFGASAGILLKVKDAMVDLVKSTIDVQKSLTDINVILNASSGNLNQFGNELFKIASDTGQSFKVASAAATEFARQGLNLEQTLQRTKDALILTRLTGNDVKESIDSLTASINSFSKDALTSTEIVNKFARVDAAFAVSASDLAEAIKRSGASASAAGIDINNLIGLVTSLQQTTALGGPKIGNALKSIFERLQKPQIIQDLSELGIVTRDIAGNALPALEVLKNLASGFDGLSKSSQVVAAQQVGSLYQINLLKAALGDLGKEYNIVQDASETSASATNEAIQRNIELNTTLAAAINKAGVALTKFGSGLGQGAISPALNMILNAVTGAADSIDTRGSKDAGVNIAKGIVEGLGDYLTGAGGVLIGAVIIKLLGKTLAFARDASASLLEMNRFAAQSEGLQTNINQILIQRPDLQALILRGTQGQIAAETQLLAILERQAVLKATFQNLSTEATAGVISRGGLSFVQPHAAEGYVPGMERMAALKGGYFPGSVQQTSIGGNNITYNTNEQLKNFSFGTAIMPPQSSQAGQNYKSIFEGFHGINPYAAEGYIPYNGPGANQINPILEHIYDLSGAGPTKTNASINILQDKVIETSKAFSLTTEQLNKLKNAIEQNVNGPGLRLPGNLPLGETLQGANNPYSGGMNTGLRVDTSENFMSAYQRKERERLQTVADAKAIIQANSPGASPFSNNLFENGDSGSSIAASSAMFRAINPSLGTSPFVNNVSPNPWWTGSDISLSGYGKGSLNRALSPSLGISPFYNNQVGNQSADSPISASSGTLKGMTEAVSSFKKSAADLAAEQARIAAASKSINYNNMQNGILAAGFLVPIIAGVVKESIGDKTIDQRNGQVVAEGFSNTISFGTTGSLLSNGSLPVTLAMAAIGLLTTNFSKLNDITPDLIHDLDDFKDRSARSADALSTFLQTTERISSLYKGEVDSRTYEKMRNTQIEAFSKFAGDNPGRSELVRDTLRGKGIAGVRELQAMFAIDDAETRKNKETSLNIANYRDKVGGFGKAVNAIFPTGNTDLYQGIDFDYRKFLSDSARGFLGNPVTSTLDDANFEAYNPRLTKEGRATLGQIDFPILTSKGYDRKNSSLLDMFFNNPDLAKNLDSTRSDPEQFFGTLKNLARQNKNPSASSLLDSFTEEKSKDQLLANSKQFGLGTIDYQSIMSHKQAMEESENEIKAHKRELHELTNEVYRTLSGLNEFSQKLDNINQLTLARYSGYIERQSTASSGFISQQENFLQPESIVNLRNQAARGMIGSQRDVGEQSAFLNLGTDINSNFTSAASNIIKGAIERGQKNDNRELLDKKVNDFLAPFNDLNQNIQKNLNAGNFDAASTSISKLISESQRQAAPLRNQVNRNPIEQSQFEFLQDIPASIKASLAKTQGVLNLNNEKAQNNFSIQDLINREAINNTRINKKIKIGGGIDNIFSSEFGAEEGINESIFTRNTGRATGNNFLAGKGNMALGDLISSLGGEVPKELKDELIQNVAKSLGSIPGFKPATGSFEDVARTQVENRFKSNQDSSFQLSSIFQPLNSTSRGIETLLNIIENGGLPIKFASGLFDPKTALAQNGKGYLIPGSIKFPTNDTGNVLNPTNAISPEESKALDLILEGPAIRSLESFRPSIFSGVPPTPNSLFDNTSGLPYRGNLTKGSDIDWNQYIPQGITAPTFQSSPMVPFLPKFPVGGIKTPTVSLPPTRLSFENRLLSDSAPSTLPPNELSDYIAKYGAQKPTILPQFESVKSSLAFQKELLMVSRDDLAVQNKVNELVKKRGELTEEVRKGAKSLLEATREEAQLQAEIAAKLGEGSFKSGLLSGKDSSALNERRSQARLENGSYGGKDLLGDFGNQFKYNLRDFETDMHDTAIVAGKAVKSSFKDALTAISQGKDIGDAARQFGLSIASKILDRSFDTAANLVFSGLGAISKIGGYSAGGIVTGGSGSKDDVPALLTNGEYVLNKNAVQKIGLNNLQNLNKANSLLINKFDYNDPKHPTAGSQNFSSLLSSYAFEDDNNPQNIIRRTRESNFYQYLKDKQSYEQQKDAAMHQYNAGIRGIVRSGQISAGINLAGGAIKGGFSGSSAAGFNTYQTPPTSGSFSSPVYAARGGLIQGYAAGGSVFGGDSPLDNVHAMLTGGEFVVKKDIVSKLGVPFFDRLNRGVIPGKGYASGGVVGKDSATDLSNFTTQFSTSIEELKKSIDKLFAAPTNKAVNSPLSPSAAPNIITNITVNVDKNGNTQTDVSTQSNSKNGDDDEKAKQLANLIKNITVKTILEQQRPGGILADKK